MNMFGYKPDELIRASLHRFWLFRRPQKKTNQRRTIRSGTIGNFVNRYVRKDGSLVDVLWSDPGRKLSGSLSALPRHYERKRAKRNPKSQSTFRRSVQERTADCKRYRRLENEINDRKRAESALHETNLALTNAMPGISI